MDTEEDLLAKHRKERKELQSKIQALKKAAAKGDKKKKKEVVEEITLLEQELETRQAEELSNLKKEQINSVVEEIISVSLDDGNSLPSIQKQSKAQKRREKKAHKEKEREKLIDEQEVLNVHGVRNVETQKIKQILKERNLQIQEIPSDGNCLYCAIDFQLKLLTGKEMGYKTLRVLTSQYMKENKPDFLPFLSDSNSGDILNDEQYQSYCDQVANTSAWGGQVELRAITHVIKCPIEVIQANGPPILIGEEYNGIKLVLTYHRHMYGLGEHYNSVAPYASENEDQ